MDEQEATELLKTLKIGDILTVVKRYEDSMNENWNVGVVVTVSKEVVYTPAGALYDYPKVTPSYCKCCPEGIIGPYHLIEPYFILDAKTKGSKMRRFLLNGLSI